VRVKATEVRLELFPEQVIWLGKGTVIRIEEDADLSALSGYSRFFRAIVEWPLNGAYVRDSLVPHILEPYPLSGEFETKTRP
jgi:hypothetical protein